MKSIIWKIGAAATVMLGSLGPHVAHGHWTQVAPVAEVEKQSGPALEVMSLNLGTDITVTETAQCGASALNIERIDLMLWHNCNFSIKLGQISAPQLTVVTELPNLPSIKIFRSEPNQLTDHSEFWTDYSKAPAAFLNQIILSAMHRYNSPDDLVTSSYTQSLAVVNNSTQTHIVMRC